MNFNFFKFKFFRATPVIHKASTKVATSANESFHVEAVLASTSLMRSDSPDTIYSKVARYALLAGAFLLPLFF